MQVEAGFAGFVLQSSVMMAIPLLSVRIVHIPQYAQVGFKVKPIVCHFGGNGWEQDRWR